jgi:DnaJ-class molecular chaperone
MKVLNYSKNQIEDAHKRECPRCKGFGATTSDKGIYNCYLCNGHGKCWVSIEGSGWCRALHAALQDSKLY